MVEAQNAAASKLLTKSAFAADGHSAHLRGHWADLMAGTTKTAFTPLPERYPAAVVAIPPRATAVPSVTVETTPTQRDRHLQHIAEHGRMAWQKSSGYTTRARAEAAIGRFKQVIGDALRSRTDNRRVTEVNAAARALNCMVEFGRPNYVRTA